MNEKETLKQKAYRLWKTAGLPDFFNKKGPKQTPGWLVYLSHLEYTTHSPSWRRTQGFMEDYYDESRCFDTWRKAISKWPQSVWDALARASVGNLECEIAAIDGTTMARSNPSQHYIKKIEGELCTRPIQQVVMVDVEHRKFLSWRIRATPRGEKCDVPYLIEHSSVLPELVLMDKGFDSQPLHTYLREVGVWSVAPVKKNCVNGRYRKQLRDYFDWSLYWQRSIVECLFSAVKRLFGSHVRARTARMQRAEISSKFIAYNIGAILFTIFYRAQNTCRILILFPFELESRFMLFKPPF